MHQNICLLMKIWPIGNDLAFGFRRGCSSLTKLSLLHFLKVLTCLGIFQELRNNSILQTILEWADIEFKKFKYSLLKIGNSFSIFFHIILILNLVFLVYCSWWSSLYLDNHKINSLSVSSLSFFFFLNTLYNLYSCVGILTSYPLEVWQLIFIKLHFLELSSTTIVLPCFLSLFTDLKQH